MGDDEQFPADEDPTNTQGWGIPVQMPDGLTAYQGQNFIGGAGASVVLDPDGSVTSYTAQGISRTDSLDQEVTVIDDGRGNDGSGVFPPSTDDPYADE
jgi:hypothetical protein